MLACLDALRVVRRDCRAAATSLDEERGDVGEDENEGDPVRRDEDVLARAEVACEAAEEDVVGRDERAWGEHDEEVLDDVDPFAFWVRMEPEAAAEAEREAWKNDEVSGRRSSVEVGDDAQ
jgi:hypothetical protein